MDRGVWMEGCGVGGLYRLDVGHRGVALSAFLATLFFLFFFWWLWSWLCLRLVRREIREVPCGAIVCACMPFHLSCVFYVFAPFNSPWLSGMWKYRHSLKAAAVSTSPSSLP